jgi:hypothetical protein
MLRSVLVAAFSAVAALGVLSGFSDAKEDVRANTQWPSVAVSSTTTDSTIGTDSSADGAGS